MDLKLKGQIALVTGGSRGIGKAICLSLAAEGVHVGVNYQSSREGAEAVAKECTERFGVKAIAIAGDMGKEADAIAAITTMEQHFGSIDLLVNNAAKCPTGPITSYSVEEWERTFSINMTGVFLLSREVVKRWQAANRAGTIVNIASQAAYLGSTTGHLPYDSSKGAMVSFTIALAREVAKQGIRVLGVAPGMVRTEMVAKTWEQRKEGYLARIPLYRIAEPEEIADVVTFLASSRAGYMTGTTVNVTGGQMMG